MLTLTDQFLCMFPAKLEFELRGIFLLHISLCNKGYAFNSGYFIYLFFCLRLADGAVYGMAVQCRDDHILTLLTFTQKQTATQAAPYP